MTWRRPSRIAALAAAVGLTVAACGGSDSADDTAAAPVETTAEAAPEAESAATDSDTGATDVGSTDAAPALLQFTAPLVGGGELDAAELSTKPTAFWFWSPT